MSRAVYHRKSVRDALIAAIERDVTCLVRRNLLDELESVMELTGYVNNGHALSSKRLGKAIIALASAIDRDMLEGLAHGAAFYLARSVGAKYDRADVIGDQTLRDAGVDVERRNAKIKADEERIMAQARRAA